MLYLFEDGNGNSQLQGKDFILPDGIKKKLTHILNNYTGNRNDKYYSHLENLVSNGKVPYGDMKKIKHFFDTFQGKEDSMEYTLNGGDDMKLWVNMTLSNATQRIKNDKYAKKAAGISNAFIKPHEKDRQNSNPTKVSVAKPNTSGSMTKNVQDDNAFKMEGKEKRKIIFDLKGLIELKV